MIGGVEEVIDSKQSVPRVVYGIKEIAVLFNPE